MLQMEEKLKNSFLLHVTCESSAKVRTGKIRYFPLKLTDHPAITFDLCHVTSIVTLSYNIEFPCLVCLLTILPRLDQKYPKIIK